MPAGSIHMADSPSSMRRYHFASGSSPTPCYTLISPLPISPPSCPIHPELFCRIGYLCEAVSEKDRQNPWPKGGGENGVGLRDKHSDSQTVWRWPSQVFWVCVTTLEWKYSIISTAVLKNGRGRRKTMSVLFLETAIFRCARKRKKKQGHEHRKKIV